jgi:hypothetical protein
MDSATLALAVTKRKRGKIFSEFPLCLGYETAPQVATTRYFSAMCSSSTNGSAKSGPQTITVVRT